MRETEELQWCDRSDAVYYWYSIGPRDGSLHPFKLFYLLGP
jgi:hypothetical protein